MSSYPNGSRQEYHHGDRCNDRKYTDHYDSNVSDSSSDKSFSVSDHETKGRDDDEIPTAACWLCTSCNRENPLSNEACYNCKRPMESAVEYKADGPDYSNYRFDAPQPPPVLEHLETWQNLIAMALDEDNDIPTQAYHTALQQVREAQKMLKERPDRDLYLNEANELSAFQTQFQFRIENGSDDEAAAQLQKKKKKKKKRPNSMKFWYCAKCNFANLKRDKQCDRCANWAPVKPTQWRCERCTTVNHVKSVKCTSCKGKRFEPTEDWTCGNCGAMNPPEKRQKCETCHQDPREVEKKHLAKKRKDEKKKKKKKGKKKQSNVVVIRVESAPAKPRNPQLADAKRRYAERPGNGQWRRGPPRFRLGPESSDSFNRRERYSHSRPRDNYRGRDDGRFRGGYRSRSRSRSPPPRRSGSGQYRSPSFGDRRESDRRRRQAPPPDRGFNRGRPQYSRSPSRRDERPRRSSPPRNRRQESPPPRNGFGRQDSRSRSPPRRSGPRQYSPAPKRRRTPPSSRSDHPPPPNRMDSYPDVRRNDRDRDRDRHDRDADRNRDRRSSPSRERRRRGSSDRQSGRTSVHVNDLFGSPPPPSSRPRSPASERRQQPQRAGNGRPREPW